jgi:hypothetical protein
LNTRSTNISEGIVQFLYARVSTSDQTAAHQLQQARAAGFDIDEDNVIKDEGVSGVSTCFAERDGGRRLLEKLRAGDVLVVRWLDRLGRNYDGIRDTVQALMRKGVIVRTVINTFDGSQTDPIQKSIRDGLPVSVGGIRVKIHGAGAAQHVGCRRRVGEEAIHIDVAIGIGGGRPRRCRCSLDEAGAKEIEPSLDAGQLAAGAGIGEGL